MGKSVTRRDHTPQEITAIARQMMGSRAPKIDVDDGTEIAKMILDVMSAI